jgi:hypothetical protein
LHHWDYPEEEREERYLGMTALQFNLAFFLVASVVAAAAFLYFGGTKVLDDMVDDGEPVRSVAEQATPTPEAAAAAASPTPVASSVTRAPVTAEEAAEAAVLTIYDLPLGWRKAPPEEDEDEDGGVFELSGSGASDSSGGECDLDELDFSDEVAVAEGDDYDGPNRESVSSGVSVLASDDAAEAAFEALAASMERCQGALVEIFEQALVDEATADVDGPVLTGSEVGIEKPSLPAVGDSMIVYRIAGSITMESNEGPIQSVTVTFTTDFVFVRSGALLEWVVYSTLGGVDDSEVVTLLRRAAEKLAAADASLGG